MSEWAEKKDTWQTHHAFVKYLFFQLIRTTNKKVLFLKRICGMLLFETLKFKKSDFLNSNTCFYSRLYGIPTSFFHLYSLDCIGFFEFSLILMRLDVCLDWPNCWMYGIFVWFSFWCSVDSIHFLKIIWFLCWKSRGFKKVWQ